jgi:arylformamidase
MSAASEIVLTDLPDFKEVLDISAPLKSAPTYPGDRACLQEWMARLDDGDGYSLSALSLCSHTGTHLDFPSHLLKGDRSLDSYPLNRFIIPAEVISVPGEGPAEPSSLQDCRLSRGQALLFKTANSDKGLMHRAEFAEDYVSLCPELAHLCAAQGIGLVGIDYLSVDRYADDALPVHRILMENNILILEGLDLASISCGRYLLICLPLKLHNAEASPVRAVLVR